MKISIWSYKRVKWKVSKVKERRRSKNEKVNAFRKVVAGRDK
jgi:hypothetical protein